MTIDDFIQERVYLKGVSPRTVEWYQGSFRAFANALESKQIIIVRIAQLKARGASHITINSYLRCINAYLPHTEHGRDAIRIPKLKEEQKILQTLSTDAIVRITKFRPKTTSRNLFRAHLIVLTILDTGLRISEVLGLVVTDVDFGNLLLRVNGKGSKHRLVPFSFELRKLLFRYTRSKARLLFGTKNETQVSTVNIGRDVRMLGQRLGITGVPVLTAYASTYLCCDVPSEWWGCVSALEYAGSSQHYNHDRVPEIHRDRSVGTGASEVLTAGGGATWWS